MTRIMMVTGPNCSACKRMKTVIKMADIDVEILDAFDSAANTEYAINILGVKGTPTLIRWDDNVETGRHIGAMTLPQFKQFAQ